MAAFRLDIEVRRDTRCRAPSPGQLVASQGVTSGTLFRASKLPQLAMEAAMKRSLICFCSLMVLYRPGYTQTSKAAPAFYIVLNSLTKTCTVVDKTPRTDTPNITVASDTIYKTRAEAEMAIKTLTPCNQ
jgi:hypothetical protein